MKSTVIILAMHGAPPNDYPREDLREYFQLHGALEASSHNGNGKNWPIAERFAHIDAKMRAWPRTEANDPFYAGSVALAQDLEKKAGYPVLLGFNEFCGPSLEQAFEQAAGQAAARVIVITPMMTAGGEHAEVDIPAKIDVARPLYPEIEFIYAWPFNRRQVAGLLTTQINQVLSLHYTGENDWR